VDGPSGRTLLSRDIDRVDDRLALSGDGQWVAYVDGDWNTYGPTVTAVDTGTTTLSLSGKAGAAGQIDSFSPDSRSLAVAAGDGIEIWDVASGTRTTTYALPGWSVGNAGLSPNWSTAGAAVLPLRDPTAPNVFTPFTTLLWRPADGSVVQSLGTSLNLT